MLKKVDRSHSASRPTRALLGIAAAIVVVAGATAVIINRTQSADDTPFTGNDASIARAALISVDQLGPGWAVDPHVKTTWADSRTVMAAQPECADHTAAVAQLEAESTGATAPLYNLQNQAAFESVTIYPTKRAASRVMDSMEAPTFPNCWFASFDAMTNIDFPGLEPSTSSFELAPPTPHGDRQIDLGIETRTATDSNVHLYHGVWIQVDRAIIHLIVSPDGRSSDDPTGLLETSISHALGALGEAMSAG